MSRNLEVFDEMIRAFKYYMEKSGVLKYRDPIIDGVDTFEGVPIERFRNIIKAFDIIVMKKVDLWLLELYDTWENYKNRRFNCSKEQLTKEEFIFLRRVCNEIELEHATKT